MPFISAFLFFQWALKWKTRNLIPASVRTGNPGLSEPTRYGSNSGCEVRRASPEHDRDGLSTGATLLAGERDLGAGHHEHARSWLQPLARLAADESARLILSRP